MTLSRPALAAAIAAGLLLGAGYAVSPLAIWFVAWTAWLFWWSARGLGARERRIVWLILGVATGLRVLAVAMQFLSVIDVHRTTSFFWDGDGIYLKQRALAIRNTWIGVQLPPSWSLSFDNVYYKGYGWTSYLYVLAYVQYLLGPAPYGVHLINIALFMTSVVVLHRFVRTGYGAVVATAGLLLVCFLPTLIAWSSSALKESLYLLLCVSAVASAIAIVRADRLRNRMLALLVLVLALALNSTIRQGGLFITAGGVISGLAAAALVRRPVALVTVVAAAVLAASIAWQSPQARTWVMHRVIIAAINHQGNVSTEGHFYKVLDPQFYSGPGSRIFGLTPVEGVRFVIRALVAFVIVPLPWDVRSRAELLFLAQQTVWLVMVLFAIVGLFAGLARDPLLTLLLAGISVTAAGVIAVNSGNVGTMIRFRDTMVPFMVWLSALGGVSFLRWIAAHATGAAGTARVTLERAMVEGS